MVRWVDSGAASVHENAFFGKQGLMALVPYLLLYVLAAVIRAWYAWPITFPPLDDPAYYLKVAENLAQGKGLYIEAVWSYLYPFESPSHPSNEYWMPLTSLMYAPFFAVFGSSLRVAQVPGILLGSILAPLTAYASLRFVPSAGPAVALGAGALIAANPVLAYQSVSADSALPFAVLVSVSLLLLSGPRSGPLGLFFGGIFAALSYLTRSDGLLLGGAFVLYSAFSRENKRKALWPFLMGFLPLFAAWHLRNWTTFGEPFPVSMAWAVAAPDYPSLFSYATPGPWELAGAVGLWPLLALRLQALGHNIFGVLNFALFPWGILSVAGLLVLWRSGVFRLVTLYTVLLLLVTALVFSVPTLNGTYYHSIGGSLSLLAIAGLYLLLELSGRLQRRLGWRRSAFPAVLAGLLAVAIAQLAISRAAVSGQHAVWERQYAAVSDWLAGRPAGTVMTTQPHTLHYAAGLPTVMLPASDPPDVAAEAARRYGVRYLVLTESFGLYPDAVRYSPEGPFTLAHRGDGFEVYEVKDGPQ